MDVRVTPKKNYEFRRLYNKGKTAVTPYLVVYCLKNRTGQRRVGYTVSTKLGKAVTRNRIRRQLREIYRLNADRLVGGVDMILVARTKCMGGDYHRMEKAFLKCCSQLGLMKEEAK